VSRETRPKGEYAISVALAGAVVLTALMLFTKWQPSGLKDVATSAEEFILTTTGIGSQVPDISGFEKLKTYRLGQYRAGLYRTSPAPLLFAAGRFVIYNPNNQPVFKLDTLEGSKDPWTTLYDFTGRLGLTAPGSHPRPSYTRNLTGNGVPDIVVGQYSGGDHCCTTASVIELGKDSVKLLGTLEGLDSLPFEGIEFRKLDKGSEWNILAQRRYSTMCGSYEDDADVLSVYAYSDGQYSDQTTRFSSFLDGILHQKLEQWAHVKKRTLQLLQTVAIQYAMLGQVEEAKQFFTTNLTEFLPYLQNKNVDAKACQEDLEVLLDQVPNASP